MAKPKKEVSGSVDGTSELHILSFSCVMPVFIISLCILISQLTIFEREFNDYVNIYLSILSIPVAVVFTRRLFGHELVRDLPKYILKYQQDNSNQSTKNLTSSSPRDDYERIKKNEANSRPKIDPKFFKPKYLIHELMSIWSTTYTVITWGSAWMIGGTIVATERFASKIKTKCTREQQQQKWHRSSASTGHSDASSTDSSKSYTEANKTGLSNKNSLNRMIIRTRKYIMSAKKKLNKFRVSGSMPQLTDTAVVADQSNEQTFWSRW